MVKNLSAMWETWAPFLGWEDPLLEGMAIHISILAWRIPQTGFWWAIVHEVTKNQTQLSDQHSLKSYTAFMALYLESSPTQTV